MKKKPFKKLNTITAHNFLNGFILSFNDDININYRKLIEKCWSVNLSDRPTFQIICELLKSPAFLIKGVDVDVYYEYIELIDEYQSEINPLSFEDFVSTKSDKFKEIHIINLNENKEEEEDDDDRNSLNIEHLNLSKFTKLNKIGQGLYGEVFIVKSNENGTLYSAKISKKRIF